MYQDKIERKQRTKKRNKAIKKKRKNMIDLQFTFNRKLFVFCSSSKLKKKKNKINIYSNGILWQNFIEINIIFFPPYYLY